MDCMQIRTAISAQLDGEDSPTATGAVAAHLRGCDACRAFEREARVLHGRMRVSSAPPVPDLTARILSAIGDEDGGQEREDALARRTIRLVLAVVAVVQIATALPALVLGDDAGLPVHTAHHLGSFAVAIGVGFLVAAWHPARVMGVLPVVAAVVLCLVVTSAVDVSSGRAVAAGELSHVTELVGLAALWLLGRTQRDEERGVELLVATQ
jgi:predicted anti-sigma-YlaC factor YlaD